MIIIPLFFGKFTETEVENLDGSSTIEHQIGRFNVTVDEFEFVDVLQSQSGLPDRFASGTEGNDGQMYRPISLWEVSAYTGLG